MFGKCSLGVEEGLRNTAQLPTPACTQTAIPPVKLASAQLKREREEDEEKSLGGEIVLGGVTAFVGVGGGGGIA